MGEAVTCYLSAGDCTGGGMVRRLEPKASTQDFIVCARLSAGREDRKAGERRKTAAIWERDKGGSSVFR